MKKILLIVIIGLVYSTVQAQMDSPLKKGMPNTVTLSNGEVIYDLSGEWDAIYEIEGFGSQKDIVTITQQGNKVVGIKLIGWEYVGKGEETIKGELGKDGFKSLSVNTCEGWMPATAKLDKKGNNIKFETYLKGIFVDITLTRK